MVDFKAKIKDVPNDPGVYMMLDENGGFFVMQMQLTDPVLFIGPKFYEGTHNERASAFVKSLKDKEYFEYLNIVMRDYLGAGKAKEIIALNQFKGTLKASLADEFATKCA